MSMKEEYTAIDMATAAADGFRDGQRAAQSAGVPDGYALVPVIATQEMIAAAVQAVETGHALWSAMLAAVSKGADHG